MTEVAGLITEKHFEQVRVSLNVFTLAILVFKRATNYHFFFLAFLPVVLPVCAGTRKMSCFMNHEVAAKRCIDPTEERFLHAPLSSHDYMRAV